MNFINIHRFVQHRDFFLPGKPVAVRPFVAGQVIDLGGSARSGLLVHGVGVRFHQQATVRRLNGIFVAVILGNTVHHRFPNLRCNKGHRVGCFGPIVKVPGHSHTHGVGRPHAKSVGAFFYFMNTEETVCFIVFALVEEVDRQLIFFFKLFHSIISLFSSVVVILILPHRHRSIKGFSYSLLQEFVKFVAFLCILLQIFRTVKNRQKFLSPQGATVHILY